MINVRRIRKLPENFGQFAEEIGAGMGALYGTAAASAYMDKADAAFNGLIAHPNARVWTCGAATTDGLLVAVIRRGVAYFTVLHVLEGAAAAPRESALVDRAVESLRGESMRGILGEFVAYRALTVESPFHRLGFSRFDRQMMIADLDCAELAMDGERTREADGLPEAHCADALVDAYVEHPGRGIHPEVQNTDEAVAFIRAYRSGAFGAAPNAFYRVAGDERLCEGVILGVEGAPGVGFVLHVAVARRAQGRGMGSALMGETAEAFRVAGYSRVALGVTRGNPAERLYLRLGFKPLTPVQTYVWWGDED